MLAESLQIFKDTRQLTLLLLQYQKNVSRMVRWENWRDRDKAKY